MAAADMAAGIARKTEQRQQRGIDAKHDGADAHTEAVGKIESEERIPPEKSQDHQRKIEKVAVKILQQERKAGFAA